MTTERGTAAGWPGMWYRGDAWEDAGWRTPSNRLPVVLAYLALILVAMTVDHLGHATGELGERAEQRAHYVAVAGRTTESAASSAFVDFRGTAAPFGELVVRIQEDEVERGRDITLLVHRDDPSTYVLPAERPDPGRDLAKAGATALLALVTALLAASVVRTKRVDVEPVRRVAVRALDPVFPPPAVPPRSRYEAAVRLLPGIALALVGTVHAVTAEPQPAFELVAVSGRVEAEPRGGELVVRFSDPRTGRVNGERPLTGAERATGLGPGDETSVVYAMRPWGAEPEAFPTAWAVGGAAAATGLVVLGFAIAWPYRLRRALASPPALVDVVGWSRRKRGLDWLYITPVGATHPHQVAAIRLARGVVPPTAFTGPLYVHGRLERWSVAVVRDPLGGPYWPVAPVCGWLRSSLHGYGPAAPSPPPQPGA